MAKAYRTDVLVKKKFQDEVQQRKSSVPPERVPCPEAACPCTYEMFGCTPANLANYTAILQQRVGKEHPSHSSEVLAVNEFRRPLKPR